MLNVNNEGLAVSAADQLITSTRRKSEIVIWEAKRRRVRAVHVSSHVLHCNVHLCTSVHHTRQ